MFVDYKKQVLQKYREKRDADKLSSNLTHPTPGSLRAECVVVCGERFNQKVLRTFFGSYENKDAYLKAIEGFDIDKFRPLQKFIKGAIIETDAKNVDLLAWLINFDSKKACSGNELIDQDKETGSEQKDENVATGILEGDEETAKVEEDTIPSGNPDIGRRRRFFFFMAGTRKKIFFITGGIMSVLLVFAIYWFSNYNSVMSISAKGDCMYWTGDHYQPIPCSEKIENAFVIALDTMKVRYFKRIIHCDTITVRSIGSVWYSKIDNKVEFYTSPGNHPVQTGYRLKPATKYIIDKYCQVTSK